MTTKAEKEAASAERDAVRERLEARHDELTEALKGVPAEQKAGIQELIDINTERLRLL